VYFIQLFLFFLRSLIKEGKSIKKIAKSGLILLLVFISIPTLGLLFLQNKQVQTIVTEYLTDRVSEKIDGEISVSYVHYSFFKRLQLHDLYIEDRLGDTLIYSEVCNIRLKKFRPDKKDILIRKISFENAMLQITIDESRVSTIKTFIDTFKKDIPPEEKTIISIDKIGFENTNFRLVNTHADPPATGINFRDLNVYDISGVIEDFLIKHDTTSMRVVSASGNEISGFILKDVEFDLSLSKKFMTFSNGEVLTPESKIAPSLVDFRFNHPQNFKQVYDSVLMTIVSDNSLLQFNDIAYFFPVVQDLEGMIRLNGYLSGRLGDLYGKDVVVDYLDETRLEFDMRLAGLPSSDSLYMDFDFREFKTNPDEFKQLSSSFETIFEKGTHYMAGLESVKYHGNFRGYKTDFETAGYIETNLGKINIDLNMQPDSTRTLLFKGSVGSDGFNLGELLANESDVGKIAFNLDLDGINSDGNIKANVAGTIDTLGLYGYDYSMLQLEGTFINKIFDGSLFIKDPNIHLAFKGRVDLENEVPAFDFTLDVANFRPYYLNLRDDDPEYFISFLLKTDMTGSKIDDLNGNIILVNSLFKRSGSQVQLYDILMTTKNSPDTSFLAIQSEAWNAKIWGSYKLSELPSTFKGIVNEHFDLFPDPVAISDTSTSFSFTATLDDTHEITDFFFPEFKLAPGMSLSGDYIADKSKKRFSLEGSLPDLRYNRLNWNEMQFSALADTQSLELTVTGERIATESNLVIEHPEIEMTFANNANDLLIKWSNEAEPLYAGNVSTSGQISILGEKERAYALTIHPSWFVYDSKEFTIPQSGLEISPGGIVVDSVFIKGTEQFFLTHGKITGQEEDSISFSMHNFNLQMFNEFSKDFPLDLKGTLSGQTSVKKELNSPVLTSNLMASDLEINDQVFGNTIIRADWVRSRKEIELELFSVSDNQNNIDIKGLYRPADSRISFDLSLTDMKLIVLQPFLNDFLDDVSGSGNLNLNITGTVSDPLINGAIDFQDASVLVKETQSRYFFSDKMILQNNDLYFDRFNVKDDYGNSLFAEGNISTGNFKELYLNLNLNANNFNFLSTSRLDNEQFYGDIYATGIINVYGPTDQLRIRATANTESGTNLKLPLYNPAEIQTTDFITFIKSDETDQPVFKTETNLRNNILLDLELEVNSSTSVQLIFDPKVGDIIQASGAGTLKFEMDESGNFSMFGSVYVVDGEYLFTLQNVINKRFRVKPGGSISWNGSPKSAIVDLEAVYETKASTYNLAPEPTEEMKKRIPVHCLLSLQGPLENPTIQPQIQLPTAEPETRSLVETSIGTDEELMRQFISLLVINNFISSAQFGSNALGGTSTGVAGVTASELLSNQLSNWLSQISNDFDIGVNYRPGDAISNDEVEVALSTQLLNDRIIFSGNLDVLADEVRTAGGEASNIVGDFDLEFKITDKISVKAFNRVNDDRIIRPSLYTQGVGLIYRSEFDSISDLFKNRKSSQDDEDALQKEGDEAVIREDTEERPLP
jgi:hypothetical protein